MNYKGYSLERLNSLLTYNPDKGEFTSKVSGKTLVDIRFSHRDETTKKVNSLMLSRVAIFMMTGKVVEEGDRVVHKDGDIYNLQYSNLSVVPYIEVYQQRSNSLKNSYLETEEDHIFVGTINRLFVVRRGNTQGLYRTYNKQEAIDVRDRWLTSDKKLNEWDNFTPKWYKQWLNDNKNEDNVNISTFTP